MFQMEGKASAEAQRLEYPWEVGTSLVCSRDRREMWQDWSDKGRKGEDEIREIGGQIILGLQALHGLYSETECFEILNNMTIYLVKGSL